MSTYVYEDACIGAIVDAVARIDNSFQDKGYCTVLTQNRWPQDKDAWRPSARVKWFSRHLSRV